MLVTCQEMAEAEAKLFAGGVSAEPYMDEAGRKCAEAIRSFFPDPGRAEIFCGTGNNGGDALVVARWLRRWGWAVSLNFSHGPEEISDLAMKKLVEFEATDERIGNLSGRLVLVDGLLGIGARGDLRGPIREQADAINALRAGRFGTTFAIDIPTGLNADTGVPGGGAVVADCTLSITAAKTGFAEDSATNHLGRLVEIPLDIPVTGDDSIRFLFPSNLRPRLPRREFDTHKGSAGRVTVVAGSRGFTGAASLVARGASNTGAGLVTVCVPGDIYPVVASLCPPEVMVRPVSSLREALEPAHDVVAIGPGLGSDHDDEVVEAIRNHPAPLVADADALNALARASLDLSTLPANRVLTPHPGELARLTAERGERVPLTRRLADDWGLTLLHKGARSAIATPGEPVELNTSGHPGMASGGMGDVLTGVCASLVAQGLSLHDAACAGSWLIGRAAEIARDGFPIAGGSSLRPAAPESVTATTMATALGPALLDLRADSP